jgi:hypothetical protein
MPNPHIEGGGYADPITKLPQRRSNTIAQFNDQVSTSNLAEFLRTYYGNPFALDLERAQVQLAHDLERTVLFGKQYDVTGSIARASGTDSGRQTGTAGVWDTIQTKRVGYDTAITESGLDAFLGVLFGDAFGGGDTKYCFSGMQVYSDISGFVKNKFREINAVGKVKYGLSISEYISPVGAGSAMFIEERQFLDPVPGIGAGSVLNPQRGAIVALDPLYFRLLKIGPSITRVKNTTPIQQDRKALAIITWLGVMLSMERFHGIYSPNLN